MKYLTCLLKVRRKFLRQNREIARINSNQSQRIRELENEFARMLTENLELRSYIIRLEKEAESNNTHRIADHALEVKAKLEAQLSIFSSLLEGLGAEPPRKRHSPSPRSEAKPKSSPTLASPARRLRNVARDIEARASQEARLPAIPEYKPYPREPRATLK
jgi:N-acetyl-beta-hexosaminidase